MDAADSESAHGRTRVDQHAGCAHLVFVQDFLGSNDIKVVVKFECMGFKAWRSNRPLSLTLSEAFRCGNSRVKASAYSRYFQVLILGDAGSL